MTTLFRVQAAKARLRDAQRLAMALSSDLTLAALARARCAYADARAAWQAEVQTMDAELFT
jgi:hypothetical protein